MDKRFSLLRKLINYGRKKSFITSAQGLHLDGAHRKRDLRRRQKRRKRRRFKTTFFQQRQPRGRRHRRESTIRTGFDEKHHRRDSAERRNRVGLIN
jgi:hypothetical protein